MKRSRWRVIQRELVLKRPLLRILQVIAAMRRWVSDGFVAGMRGLFDFAGDVLAGGRAFQRGCRLGRNATDGRASANFKSPPAQVPVGRRVYAIGDIHGRADLLCRLLEVLRKDAGEGDFVGPPILVFLGDYVDRGFQSREVISILLSDVMSTFETFFLKGNHEETMLQFLTDPSIGPRWGQFGGVETLVSYGVQPPRTRNSIEEWSRASRELRKAMPPDHLRFLSRLDLTVRIGDYFFVHAGVRPSVPLDQQTESDLLWIREEFLASRKQMEAVIVHGHSPSSKPHRDSRRIGLDTAAYISGRLTAARLESDSVVFFETAPTFIRSRSEERRSG